MSRGTLPLCGTPAHTAPKSHACGLPGWPRTPPSHSCLRSVNQEAPKRLLSYLIPTGFPLWFKPRTRPVRGSFETLAPFLVWFSPQHLRQQCAGSTRPRPSSFAKPRLPFGSQVGWPEARRTDNLQPNLILFSNIDKTSTHASRCLPAFAGPSIDFHGRSMRFSGPRGRREGVFSLPAASLAEPLTLRRLDFVLPTRGSTRFQPRSLLSVLPVKRNGL